MDQKYFDRVISDMEQVGCSFRGWTLTKDQFEKVEDLMKDIEMCYVPGYVDNMQDSGDNVCEHGYDLEDEIVVLLEAEIQSELYNNAMKVIK